MTRRAKYWYNRQMISLIVAKSRNNVIGKNNTLPWRLKSDLKHFKDVTMGMTVVMGRKTYQSIFDRLGGPLPGRSNVVLTRDSEFRPEGVTVLDDISKIGDLEGDVCVIGGGEIYRLALPYVERIYCTEVDATIEGDTFFPEISADSWTEIDRTHHSADESNDFAFDFVTYQKTN